MIMRIDNILIQPVDASDGDLFVIMDVSSGSEIAFTRNRLIRLHNAIQILLGV